MADESTDAQEWSDEDSRSFLAERVRHERMRRGLTGRLLTAADIAASEYVVDIGCGFGDTALQAARSATSGRVLGVDLSASMLAEARALAEQQGVGNVDFVEADAQTHAFAPGEFDVVLSSFGTMFFADPQAAFANIATALRPGGRLVFVCWRDRDESEFFAVPLAAIAAHTAPPEHPDPDTPGPFSLADPERIRALLSTAGFGDIGIDGVDEPFRVGTGPEDVLDFYRNLPMIRPALDAVDEDTAAAITRTLRAELAARQDTDGVTLGSATWLVTARR